MENELVPVETSQENEEEEDSSLHRAASSLPSSVPRQPLSDDVGKGEEEEEEEEALPLSSSPSHRRAGGKDEVLGGEETKEKKEERNSSLDREDDRADPDTSVWKDREDKDGEEGEQRAVACRGEERRCSTDSCSGCENLLDSGQGAFLPREVLGEEEGRMAEEEREAQADDEGEQGDPEDKEGKQKEEEAEEEERILVPEEGRGDEGGGGEDEQVVEAKPEEAYEEDKKVDGGRREKEEGEGEGGGALRVRDGGDQERRKEEEEEEEEERDGEGEKDEKDGGGMFWLRGYHHSFGEPVEELREREEGEDDDDGVSVHLRRYHHSFGESVQDESLQDGEEEEEEDKDNRLSSSSSSVLRPGSVDVQSSPAAHLYLSKEGEDEEEGEEEEDLPLSPIARYNEAEEACSRRFQEKISALGQENGEAEEGAERLSLEGAYSSEGNLRDGKLSAHASHAPLPQPSSPSSSSSSLPSFPSALDDADLLPPFANEENRRLHQDIVKARSEIRQLNGQIAERQDRTKMIEVHLKNLLAEIQNMQRIQQAKNESIESERHVSDLHERHTGKLHSQIKQLDAEVDRFEERLLSVQEEFLKKNEEIDKFKLLMNWNEKELRQWITAETQQQQDRLEVERLQRADEREIKHLNLQIERLCKETHEKRNLLHEVTTEANALQAELNVVGEQFKAAQRERLHVIDQWEVALEGMKQKDEDIRESASRYSLAQDEFRQKLEKLKQLKLFTQDQVQGNQELSKELQQLGAKVERLRKDFLDAKQKLSDIQEQGEDFRSQLSAVATATARSKAELGTLSEELEERKQTLSSLIYRRDQTKKKINFELQNALQKDDLLKEAESFCQQIEQQCEGLEKTLKKAREEYFEMTRKKATEKLLSQSILGEIGSSQAALKSLTIQLQRLDQNRQRQQELLYSVEFQSQLMQRKVARVSGYCNTAEKKEFDQKIEKLEKILAQQSEQCQLLKSQKKRLDGEFRKTQKILESRDLEAKNLVDLLSSIRLECEFLKKEVQTTEREKENILVEFDTLKLDAKKLKDQLMEECEAVCTAENDKLRTQENITEEILKAEHRLELAKTKARAADEERHRLTLELSSRNSKISALESKYSVVVQKIKHDEGGGGGGGQREHSQAYYIIKASQAKEELQRIGDDLDQKLRDAERDSRCLENTLKHLKIRNERYKSALVEENDFVNTQKHTRDDLEAQLKDLHDLLFEQKRQLEDLRKRAEGEEERVREAVKHQDMLQSHRKRTADKLEDLQKEIAEQKQKLKRACHHHRKLRKTCQGKGLLPPSKILSSPAKDGRERTAREGREQRGSSGPGIGFDPATQSNIEMEPHLESLKNHFQTLLYCIGTALQELPEGSEEEHIKQALALHGVQFSSSRPVSAASSLSSVMSFASYSSSGGVSSVSLEENTPGRDVANLKSPSVSSSVSSSPFLPSSSPLSAGKTKRENAMPPQQKTYLSSASRTSSSLQLHSSSLGGGGGGGGLRTAGGGGVSSGAGRADLFPPGGGSSSFVQNASLTRRRQSSGGLSVSKCSLMSSSSLPVNFAYTQDPRHDMGKGISRQGSLADTNTAGVRRRASDSCVVRTWGFDDALQSGGRESSQQLPRRQSQRPSSSCSNENSSKGLAGDAASVTSSRKSSASSTQGRERTSFPPA